MADALAQTGCEADVIIPDAQPDESGFINYTHKQRDGRDFYFVTNTTARPFAGEISLRGEFGTVELWNPHTERQCPPNSAQTRAAHWFQSGFRPFVRSLS